MAETLKSLPITNLDAQPILVATVGEGCPGEGKNVTDYVNPTSSTAQWSTYRMCRFPTNAKVKKVWGYITGMDTSAATTAVAATFDFNVAFSDDNNDGTPQALQALLPSNKLDGTAFEMRSTGYSTSYQSTGTGNKLFGSAIAAVITTTQVIELTFKSIFTPAARDDDLWNFLGFTNTLGVAHDPGGFFDILVVVAAAPTSASAGKLGVEVDYVL